MASTLSPLTRQASERAEARADLTPNELYGSYGAYSVAVETGEYVPASDEQVGKVLARLRG